MEWLLISWPTLILLGLGLRMALRLTYGARGPDAGDAVYDFLIITSWVLLALGVAPIILGGLYSVVGAIIVLLAGATFVEFITQRRAAQRRSLCTLIALIVERRQRLDTSALLESQAMRGRVGSQARKLFELLDTGTPLVEAVHVIPRALPREAVAYLAAGQSMKAESAALRELSQTDHTELATVWRACIDRVSYLACVLTFMILVLTFVMIKIVPEFRSIFAEFNLQLPPLTELLIYISNVFVNYFAVPVILMIALLILGATVVGICYLCDLDVLRPLSDRLFRSRRVADVLRILAVATEQRQPLPDVLDNLANVYPSSTIRRQLVRTVNALRSGGDWHEALSDARIISAAEDSLLRAAEKAANLPWAFRQIARRRDRRAVYRLSGAVQVGYPILILLLGAFVGFFVVSLFIPLVKLIMGLTG